MEMSHKTVALALVEAHAGIGEIGVGYLHIGYTGTDAFDALSHEPTFKFIEKQSADTTPSHVLTEVNARLACELIGSPLLELAGVGIADERAVSLIDSHDVREMAEG